MKVALVQPALLIPNNENENAIMNDNININININDDDEDDDDGGRSNKNVAVLPNNNDNIVVDVNVVNSKIMTDDDTNNSIVSNSNSNSTISETLYPADTYSFLSLYGPINNPGYFSYGLMVYLFQMTFLVLMVLSVTHPNWSSNGDGDNPDGGKGSIVKRLAEFIPANVSPLVRATQVTAILSYFVFADSTVLDIVTAVELFPRFEQATNEDKVGCMVFASILRLSQVGKYGSSFEAEAKRIETRPLPRCIYRKYKHVRYLCTIIPIGVILLSMICFMIILQENSNVWITKTFRVQFQDKEQGLQVYNGCYEMNVTAIGRIEGFRRKQYESSDYNTKSANFGYCINDRRWILFNGNVDNACDLGENNNELAHSSKTDTFDVSTIFEEQWYSSSNTPLDLYFVEEDGDIELNETICSSFLNDGNCDSVFNTFDYQYDGGDCCAATCSGSNCGIGMLTNAFGTNNSNTTGDGFPDCKDPDMVPITIRIDSILSSFEPQFYYFSDNDDNDDNDDDDGLGFNNYYYSIFPDGFNESSTIDEILDNPDLLQPDVIYLFTQDPIKPLLFINCDGSNVLNIYVNESMENQTETMWVNDGAHCTMTIRNDGGYEPIWYVNYTILQGDKESVESNPIPILQDSSYEMMTTYFQLIPNCYFNKLSGHIDNSTVYTGIDYDPSAKAIDWLMNDGSEKSLCDDTFFIERYALAVIYFAAPSNSSDDFLISTTGQCLWPAIVCENGAVVDLNLIENELTGFIPSEIGLLTSLEYLYLYGNQLTKSIPSEIGRLTSLQVLFFGGNQLSGTIPSEIGLLTSLVDLDLDDNQLTESIPSEIGLLTSLKYLYFSNNYLSGSIPSEIGLLTSLEDVLGYENELSGSIPSEIGLLSSIADLQLDYNDFTSSIPSEIGMLSSLKALVLTRNYLINSIPSQIGLLTSLTDLSLNENELFGTIPSEIGLLTSLEYLYLDGNYLQAPIPSEVMMLVYFDPLLVENQKCLPCDGMGYSKKIGTEYVDKYVNFFVDDNNDKDSCTAFLLELQDTNSPYITSMYTCEALKKECIICDEIVNN